MTRENIEAWGLGLIGAAYGLYEVLIRETAVHYIGKIAMIRSKHYG